MSTHIRPWSSKVAEGMCFRGWAKLLWRNGFAVGWRRLPSAAVATLLSLLNSLLGAVQRKRYGDRIARISIDPQPLFIVGHWRSGTTLLHELLTRDPRHTFPNTYECILSNHFVLTERCGGRLLGWALPERRPMDGMRLRMDGPQEDEFALCNLGLRSPYLWIIFPNGPYDMEWETLATLPAECRERWMARLREFLQSVTLVRPGRLVVKTPLHSFRVPILREMFPESRFVHIVRHPAAVFRSTVRTWRALQRLHGYQTPRHDNLEEHVLQTGKRMFQALLASSEQVPSSRWCEVKYEDLLRRPVAVLRRVYSDLHLGDFEPAEQGVRDYLMATSGYAPETRYTGADVARVRRHWGFFFERYGYDLREPQVDAGEGRASARVAGSGTAESKGIEPLSRTGLE